MAAVRQRFHPMDRQAVPISDLHEDLVALLPCLRAFFGVRRCRADTAALANEVVLRVLQAHSDGRNILNVAEFSLGVARHVFSEFVRDPFRRRRVTDVDVERSPVNPSAESLQHPEDEHDLQACLTECLRTLPEPRRAEFIEYYAGTGKNKLRRATMAERLGVAPNTLQLRMTRTRKMLRRCFEERRKALAQSQQVSE